MLLLLISRVPRARDDICTQRREGVPLLQVKMPQIVQEETQSPQDSLDQGIPSHGRQGDGHGRYLRVREAPQQARPLQ